tara:strand:- start:705 stop:1850 length:1146 start_codon:yes stop_codon:yes gene_type:complete
MKKITILLICLAFQLVSHAQITDYASGLTEVRSLTLDGTTIYATGFNNIYSVNTTVPNPTPVTVYTTPTNYFIYKTVKLGDFLYFLQENYIEATDTFIGTEIVRFDLTNPSAGIVILTSSSNFISSIALKGTKLYFSEEVPPNPSNPDIFDVDINSLIVTDAVPTVITEYATLDLGVIQDLEFNDDILYLSDIDTNEINTIDTNNPSATLQVYLTGVGFNRGLYISAADDLYICSGNKGEKIDLTNPSATRIVIGENQTYQDTNNGTPFFANFRDVVLIGNKMYMALLGQGRIVTLDETTLSTPSFTLENDSFTIYPNPSKNKITIKSNEDLVHSKIYNVLGTLVSEHDSKTIDISELNAGVYLISVETASGIYSKKLIKN